MTDKELKKLNRAELLELLLIQTKEMERLQDKLSKADSLLSNRYMQYLEAGTLAEAMLKVNGVMESAQAAADQYLENIAQMERETKAYCRKLLLEASQQANQLREHPESMSNQELEALINEKYI